MDHCVIELEFDCIVSEAPLFFVPEQEVDDDASTYMSSHSRPLDAALGMDLLMPLEWVKGKCRLSYAHLGRCVDVYYFHLR